MEHPDFCYSQIHGDCIIIKWGESGYYPTDYPKGKYTDDVIDDMNEIGGVTREQRLAMECCSIVTQGNSNIDWEEHYKMCMTDFIGR